MVVSRVVLGVGMDVMDGMDCGVRQAPTFDYDYEDDYEHEHENAGE